jgi:hypothetical protein
MPLFKGWYSQDGWRTRLVFINQVNEPANVRIKLFEGENGRLLASLKIKLKPKEMRFYNLDRIKRISKKAGVILVDADKPIFCDGHLINLENEMRVIDYRMLKVDEPSGCC